MAVRRHGRYTVETSREDKVLFPASGITKGEVIDYYEQMAAYLVPHLRDRPLVLQRFPDGIRRPGFYQKQVGAHIPEWLATVLVEVTTRDDHQRLVVCNHAATLAYLANLASLTLHPWLSRRDRLRHPDLLVIDLDPPRSDFESARRAALRVRDLFEELGLPAYAKLTGSQGVHVVVPIDRGDDVDTVRAFAGQAMALLARRHPETLTTEQRRRKRRGRLYLDVGRNAYGQTAVVPWSVRALPGAPVAVPVAWGDLERGGIGPRDCTIRNARQIASQADPWAGFRRRARSLSRPQSRLKRYLNRGVTGTG